MEAPVLRLSAVSGLHLRQQVAHWEKSPHHRMAGPRCKALFALWLSSLETDALRISTSTNETITTGSHARRPPLTLTVQLPMPSPPPSSEKDLSDAGFHRTSTFIHAQQWVCNLWDAREDRRSSSTRHVKRDGVLGKELLVMLGLQMRKARSWCGGK